MSKSEEDKAAFENELNQTLQAGMGPGIARFALACLGGVPIVGGAFGAGAGAWSEAEQHRFQKLLAAWLKLQQDEIREIGTTLFEVMARLDTTDDHIRDRIESAEYLSLVKKCFRDWSAAESEEKRRMIRNLLANAAGGEKLCGDDIIRMFIEWIDRYSERHFQIIRAVHQTKGITRAEMWQDIHGLSVREDSAEADLFKLLVQDLSIGHVIRQHRETDYQGNFLKARSQKGRRVQNPLVKSAFDDEKQYELTELGRWFVHYTMNELVPKLPEHVVDVGPTSGPAAG
jgi:hypothetical protein